MCVGSQDLPACKRIFAGIKSTGTAPVGMWAKHLDQLAIDTEYAIRRGGTSIKNGITTSA
jgi:hypothetical protein